MEMVDKFVEQSTETLRSNFIQNLPSRLERINMLWGKALDVNGEEEQLANFVSAIHYLAGGAGIHGYQTMSRLAYSVLEHIRPCIEGKCAFTREISFAIEKQLSTLNSQNAYYQESRPFSSRVFSPKRANTDNLDELVDASSEVFVLIQDSDGDLSYKTLIEGAGMNVRTFKSVLELNRAISSSYPQALVLDLQICEQDEAMPEFWEKLKQRDTSYPVLVVSNTGTIEARLMAAQIAATHFFVKPIDSYRLIDTLLKARNIETFLDSRVLLVDDDPETSQFVAFHLRSLGLNVKVLNDPLRILEMMEQHSPDLILTDLYMPGCSGMELASIIRQHEVYFDVPIVFLTSEDDEKTRLSVLKLGGDDYFEKSIDTKIVALSVKSKLERMATFAQFKKAMVWSPS